MSRGIAIVIESLGSGGAQHVAVTLANAWAARGHAVTVITFQAADTDFFRLDDRIERIVIGGSEASSGLLPAVAANVRRISALRKALRRSSAAVVLGFIGSTNILTILAARGLGIRVVVSERNDPQRQSLGRMWDRLRQWLYRFADLVVVNSSGAIEALRPHVPADRLLWLPNPLRQQAPERADEAKAWPVTFLAIGRLHPQKAYDVLLEAFAEVTTALPEAELAIVGGGALRAALEQQAAELNVTEKVRFVGQVRDPFPWYRSAQVFVHPARFEGMPNAVLEAMSEGLPVIVSDAQTGLAGIVENGANGLVVPAESVRELANAMIYIVKNSDIRQQLGARARAAVAPFQPEQAVAAWTRAVLAGNS